MSLFTCPLCLVTREFSTFLIYCRHITLFHQNESRFQISCNLSSKCSVLYKTFSAYKSHVYRHHSSELGTKTNSDISNTVVIDQTNQNDKDLNVDIDLIYDDDEPYDLNNPTELVDLLKHNIDQLDSNVNQKEVITMSDIKRSYASFILQLREEFLVSKNTTNVILSYITTLLNHLQDLCEHQVFSYCSNNVSLLSSSDANVNVIKFETLTNIINEVSKSIETITKNEYQFIKSCEQYFGYKEPTEIIVSDACEKKESAYFIPLDDTLYSILQSQEVLFQILDNIKRQRAVAEEDDDLLLSIRDRRNGNRIDDDNLLIQLYLDDIGLTNPIGSKRDKHKMSMMHFALEDVPDEHRSKLDYINLVGICESKILKVEIFLKLH